MNQPQNVLVSVCLLTYNQKQFIKYAIESALMQKTNFEYEIVIGDDCSTDSTLEICADYANRYPKIIKLLKRENNLGLMMNFVETIKHCNGQFIVYLEGDDYWLMDNKLQSQADILLNDLNVSLVHTNWKDYFLQDGTVIDDARAFKEVCKSETTKGMAGVETFLANEYGGVRASSFMFRLVDINSIINNNPDFFKDNEIKSFDYYITCHLTYRGFFHFINGDSTLYRRNINSISINTDIKKREEFHFSVLKTIMYLFKEYNIRNNSKYLFNKILSGVLSYCLHNKDYVLLDKIEKSLKLYKISIQTKHKIILFSIKHHLNSILKLIIYYNSLKNNLLNDPSL